MTRALPYVFGLVIIAILVVVARVVLTSKDPPAGPVTAVWDHEACVFCRMHVGEPAFAAQLHTEDGDVWFFDDPGCLFEFLDRDAPKVHAMEIIDQLEPTKRGLYGGACGYLSYAGDMDLAIAIRTGIVQKQTLYVQAAAGVVADSVPELEWKETEQKARALIRAAELVEEGF